MDIDAIREKLNKLRGQATRSNTWRPEDNKDNHIRILPLAGEDIPFKETYWHWNVGGKSALCPKYTHGDDCPICDLVSKMFDESDRTKDNALRDSARSLRAKLRPYVPIIDRSNEEQGPQWWPTSKSVYTEILTIIANPDFGDITNVTNGHDLVVTKLQPEPGRMYGMTKIMARPKETPLSETQSGVEDILNAIPPTDEFMGARPYQELKEIVENWLSSENEETTDDSVGKDHFSSNENINLDESTITTSAEDLDDALASLMSDD